MESSESHSARSTPYGFYKVILIMFLLVFCPQHMNMFLRLKWKTNCLELHSHPHITDTFCFTTRLFKMVYCISYFYFLMPIKCSSPLQPIQLVSISLILLLFWGKYSTNYHWKIYHPPYTWICTFLTKFIYIGKRWCLTLFQIMLNYCVYC